MSIFSAAAPPPFDYIPPAPLALTPSPSIGSQARSVHQEQPAQAPRVTAASPMPPNVHAIYPAVVARYVFGRAPTDQAAFLQQYTQLNTQINRLRAQQPTFSSFLGQQTPKQIEALLSHPEPGKKLAQQFSETINRFWTTQRPPERNSTSPQNELINLHRDMLSNLAALGATNGTLSPQSKTLIDNAFRFPTLAARETAFPPGNRLGVYPITVDDNTAVGARLAGAFMISRNDGSAAEAPHWPNGSKSILADERNGPVVLYTPGEGFEEFATPAQLHTMLAQRINNGGIPATLLAQTLPLSVENKRQPLSGDDLALGFAPVPGDVVVEVIPQLFQRQTDELEATIVGLFKTYPALLSRPDVHGAIQDAANWAAPMDGNNALLAEYERLEEKQRPSWLKELSLLHEGHYQYLEGVEQRSLQTLTPLLEDIPSLQAFAKQRLSAALKEKYPTANYDPDQIQVKITTRSRIHSGSRAGSYTDRTVDTQYLSLTDFSLKNPTAWPAADSHQHTSVTMTAPLIDDMGLDLLDDDFNPITWNTAELKAFASEIDVGGNYVKLLQQRMAPDAQEGEPGKLRTAWKATLTDSMNKQAFLGQLNRHAYPEDSEGPQWVQAVLDYPDAATRPQVDGKTIVAHTVSAHGLPLQGVLAIGNAPESALVLYSPDAPDGVSFRQLASQAALEELFNQPQWKTYAESKASPINPNSLKATLSDLLQKNIPNVLDRIAKAKEMASSAYLKPIQGNVLDALYKQMTEILIDKADFSSVSTAEVEKESTHNKVMFGIAVGTALMDVLPIVGKGVSTGVRLGRTGLKFINAPGQSIVKILDKPNRLAMIYARYAGRTTNTATNASPILRPVLRLPAAESALAPLIPRTPPAIKATTAQLPDLSSHAVPENLLAGRPKRGDGTYQVGEQFYIRYTDGTGINRPFQISRNYKAEGGIVRVIDPQNQKQVAFLHRTNDGTWRVSKLRGGGATTNGASSHANGYQASRPSQATAKRPLSQGNGAASSSTASNPAAQPDAANKRPRLAESFPGEKATLEPPVKGQNVFYHYTGKKGHSAILASRNLSPSSSKLTGERLPGNQGRHYFTDLAPDDKATAEISRTIFGRRQYGNALDKMTHYYEINTSGLQMVRSPDNPHIFYVDTRFDVPLKYRTAPGSDLVDRVIAHGETPYNPG